MDRRVGDVMHRGVVICRVSATVEKVADIMLDNNVSALVVIDERLNACGIVSKTNLLALYGRTLSLVTAEDIMSPKLLTVSPDTTVSDAIALMLENKVHQLVITTTAGSHRRPVGIFTSGDVVALMAGRSEPQSEAQMRCSECLRRLLHIGSDDAERVQPDQD